MPSSELRLMGVRLAIDDTGAGFASLAHILKLAPDLIKLDRELTSGIDHDPVRSALGTALVSFAARTGAEIIAEGIETAGGTRGVTGTGHSLRAGVLPQSPDIGRLDSKSPVLQSVAGLGHAGVVSLDTCAEFSSPSSL